jgi:hypothetical protein
VKSPQEALRRGLGTESPAQSATPLQYFRFSFFGFRYRAFPDGYNRLPVKINRHEGTYDANDGRCCLKLISGFVFHGFKFKDSSYNSQN